MNMETPADLLALIPTLINREPEEILVIITMKDGQLQAAMGMEHVKDADDLGNYVTAIVQQMAEVRPDAMVMVFYTESESQSGREPYEEVSMLVQMVLGALSPMTVNPGILVKGGRFHIYGSDHWHDLEEVKESTLAATMVLNGIPLEPNGLVIPEPTAVTDEVTQAIDDRVANIPPYPVLIHDSWVMPYVLEERALYDHLLDRGFGVTEDEAVRMIACFLDPLLRDRLMVDTLNKTVEPLEFWETLSGNAEQEPDARRVMAASSLIDNLLQWACDRHRPALFVVQAWLYWMQGRTLDAEQYCDEAEAVDPTFRLAMAFQRYVREVKRLPDGIAHGHGDGG